MLVELSMENFGPFRKKAVLDMRGTALKDHPENVLSTDAPERRVLSSAILFGPNASGKTTVVRAVAALRSLVTAPKPANTPIAEYNPFRLSKDTVGKPTTLGLRLIGGGVLYDYSVSFDGASILKESLVRYVTNRPSKVFERTGQEFTWGSKGVAGMRSIGRMTPRNSTFVSVAARMNNDMCAAVRNEIVSNIVVLDGDDERMLTESAVRMAQDASFREPAERMMAAADLGVDGIRVDDLGALRLAHRSADDGLSDRENTLPIGLESAGTLRMLELSEILADVLENGRTLFVDGLGSHLHHELCVWLVERFSSSESSKGAQLVAVTHDLLLMDTSNLLRRDQIWFVDKDPANGESGMCSLSDFSVRNDLNPLRAYLNGRFGALPVPRAPLRSDLHQSLKSVIL